MIIFKNDIKIQDIYVGRPFFKKYNTLFNPDSRIIGYYNLKIDYNIKEEKNKNIKVQTNNDTDIEKIKTDKNEENKKKIENGKNNAKTKTEGNIFFKIVFIILLIVGIIVTFLSCFYLYRGIKRKNKGNYFEELDSNINIL